MKKKKIKKKCNCTRHATVRSDMSYIFNINIYKFHQFSKREQTTFTFGKKPLGSSENYHFPDA